MLSPAICQLKKASRWWWTHCGATFVQARRVQNVIAAANDLKGMRRVANTLLNVQHNQDITHAHTIKHLCICAFYRGSLMMKQNIHGLKVGASLLMQPTMIGARTLHAFPLRYVTFPYRTNDSGGGCFVNLSYVCVHLYGGCNSVSLCIYCALYVNTYIRISLFEFARCCPFTVLVDANKLFCGWREWWGAGLTADVYGTLCLCSLKVDAFILSITENMYFLLILSCQYLNILLCNLRDFFMEIYRCRYWMS